MPAHLDDLDGHPAFHGLSLRRDPDLADGLRIDFRSLLQTMRARCRHDAVIKHNVVSNCIC